jgi:hypothetical protein
MKLQRLAHFGIVAARDTLCRQAGRPQELEALAASPNHDKGVRVMAEPNVLPQPPSVKPRSSEDDRVLPVVGYWHDSEVAQLRVEYEMRAKANFGRSEAKLVSGRGEQ